MRRLALILIATDVLMTELMQMCQMRDESFRSFAARVRGKTDTCVFFAGCSCDLKVNYTDHIIRDPLINGISYFDILREILGTTDIFTTAVNDVIALVESKEMAQNAIPAPDISVASAFRRKKATIFSKNCRSSSRNSSPANPSKQSPCPSVLFIRKSSTCREKVLVGRAQNLTLYASIASAPSIAISRHLHQLPTQTVVDCLKAQAIWEQSQKPLHHCWKSKRISGKALSSESYGTGLDYLSCWHDVSACTKKH